MSRTTSEDMAKRVRSQLRSALRDRAVHGHRETVWHSVRSLVEEVHMFGPERPHVTTLRRALAELERRGSVSVLPADNGSGVRVFFHESLT